MNYSREELSGFTLQRLASLYPQTAEDEALIQEMFEGRASISSYETLTAVVDIKYGWQEKIIQKYVDIRRETMALENPATLTPEDEAMLDTNTITKAKELEFQAKLDEANGRNKDADEPAVAEETAPEEESEPVKAKKAKK